MSHPPTLGRPATVVRYRGHVLDAGDLDAGRLQRADGGLTSRPGPLDQHIDPAHAVLHGPPGRLLRRHLRREGRRLARALETHVAGRRPREHVAVLIGDGDDRVVEGALDVRHAVGDVLALPTTGPSTPGLGLCHLGLVLLSGLEAW